MREAHVRKITTNRPGLRRLRLRRPDNLSDVLDRVHSLNDEREDGPGLQEVHHALPDVFATTLREVFRVMSKRLRLGDLSELHCNHLHSRILEPLEDATDELPFHAIGFNEDERAFHTR